MSVAEVAVLYKVLIEQLLVALPITAQNFYFVTVTNHNTKQPYMGAALDFNLNINLPHRPAQLATCLRGNDIRRPHEDYPDAPQGDLYCRVPQDSPIAGARCAQHAVHDGARQTRADREICESDRQYVPLDDGNNWKGDPDDRPSRRPRRPAAAPGVVPAPAAPTPAPPLAVVDYDPATGTYIGPGGKVQTQTDLGQTTPKEKTWETMLVPPSGS